MTSEVDKRQVRTRRLISLHSEWWVAEVRGYGQTEREALLDIATQVWKMLDADKTPHTHDTLREEFDWAYLL